MASPKRVLVVGAGIGGLAAARALAQRGFEVEVHERASAMGEVGAGVQVSPNAFKVLQALGLEAAVRAQAFEPGAWVWRDARSGRVTETAPLTSSQARYGAPLLAIHRGDLHRLLQPEAGQFPVHVGSRCTGVRNEDGRAVAMFADGAEREADAVIGADGIRSVVREALFGVDAPRFTGDMCWRALIPVARPDPALASTDITVWRGPHGHIVTYYVRGGRAINMVAIHQTEAWMEESWSVPADRSELVAAYAGWRPEVQTLFARAEDVFKWGLFDRDPLPAWTKGRITLLGDAAHPMLPYLAQGAGMAIEDGYVLAAALAEQPDHVPAALAVYEAARRPRTSRVQLRAREQGRINHLASPVQRLSRDAAAVARRLFTPTKTGFISDWVYACDVVKLGTEPPAA